MDLWFWGSPISRNYYYVIVMSYSVFLWYTNKIPWSSQLFKSKLQESLFLSSLPPLVEIRHSKETSKNIPPSSIFHIHWAFQVFGLLLMVASHFLRLNYHKKLIFHSYSTSYSTTWICLRNHQKIKHFPYNFPKYLNVPLGKTNPLQQIQDS